MELKYVKVLLTSLMSSLLIVLNGIEMRSQLAQMLGDGILLIVLNGIEIVSN